MLSKAIQTVTPLAVGVGLGVIAMVTVAEYSTTRARPVVAVDVPSGWSEAKWPFAVDLWSSGKAFTCKSVACGGEATLYLRAKIGFCNCTRGIADDAELERHSDLDLLSGTHSATGPGRPIAVAWMKGRIRPYSVTPAAKSALLMAFNDRCDAIVGIVIFNHGRPAAAEQMVIDFLNGDAVTKWARVTLGL